MVGPSTLMWYLKLVRQVYTPWGMLGSTVAPGRRGKPQSQAERMRMRARVLSGSEAAHSPCCFRALTQFLDSWEGWASLHPDFPDMFVHRAGVRAPALPGRDSRPSTFYPLFWMSAITADTFPFLPLFIEAQPLRMTRSFRISL